MAAEWWFPPSELGVRLPVCGHSILERDFPNTYTIDGYTVLDCPLCGFVQSLNELGKPRDGIPTVDLMWGSAQCTIRKALQDTRTAEGRPRSLEGLLAAMSTPGVHCIDLATATLRLGRRLQSQAPAASLVLRAWPQGCTVSGGTVMLPGLAVLLLTGGGARFHGTTFIGGGALVCCGDDFAATFDSCVFVKTTIYAVHGATVNLHSCTITLGLPGLVAHGADTCATLTSCTLEASYTAVIAERGAMVRQHHCTVGAGRASIVAHDRGTRVTCTDSAMHGIPDPGKPLAGVAVEVLDATATLRRCTVDGSMQGVFASGRAATVEVHGCTVRASLRGVAAADSASVMMRDSDIQLYKPPATQPPTRVDGLLACVVIVNGGRREGSKGGHALIDRCYLSTQGPRHRGVVATQRGVVAMRACVVCCAEVCLTANSRSVICAAHCDVCSEELVACDSENEEAVIKLVGGQVAGLRSAAICVAGGMITARGVALSGLPAKSQHAHCAVAVHEGAVLRLSGCTAKAAVHGFEVGDSTCIAHNVEISDLVHSSDGKGNLGYKLIRGQLTVKGGSVRGCTVGAWAAGSSGEKSGHCCSEFDGVEFEGNELALKITVGAGLKAYRCVVTRGPEPLQKSVHRRESVGQTGAHLSACAGVANVVNCTFKELEHDLQCYGKHGIEVSNCTFNGEGSCRGYRVLLSGRGSVRDCVFSNGVCAIHVNQARGCVVSGCHVTSGVKTGILGAAGGEVSVTGCRLEGCNSAIEMGQRSEAVVADTECTAADVAVVVAGGSVVEAQRLTVRGARMGVTVAGRGPSPTRVILEDCDISGACEGGVLLKHAGACATLERCKVQGSEVGVAIMPGAAARVSDSTVLSCQEGVVVGAGEDLLPFPCSVCGLSAEAAVMEAWSTLRAVDGTGVPGACCVHEGAYAVATLRDVAILDCTMGVHVHVSGRVDAERVEVRKAMAAFSVRRWGARSRFEQCKAVGGNAPSVNARRVLRPDGESCDVDAVPGIAIEDEGSPAGWTAMDMHGQTGWGAA